MSKIQTSEANHELKNKQLLVPISEECQQTICGGIKKPPGHKVHFITKTNNPLCGLEDQPC